MVLRVDLHTASAAGRRRIHRVCLQNSAVARICPLGGGDWCQPTALSYYSSIDQPMLLLLVMVDYWHDSGVCRHLRHVQRLGRARQGRVTNGGRYDAGHRPGQRLLRVNRDGGTEGDAGAEAVDDFRRHHRRLGAHRRALLLRLAFGGLGRSHANCQRGTSLRQGSDCNHVRNGAATTTATAAAVRG